jgi:sugar transferase EpsL
LTQLRSTPGSSRRWACKMRGMERLRRLGRSSWLKRLLDVVGASGALLIFGPLMLYLACRVRQELGSPVLFRQVRPGLGGKPFVMYKFRTMTEERDEQGNLLPDEKRLTSFGAFLRAWSLDELPELFNVLKGDMSLVGPRPLLMKYLDRYTPEQFRRHEVKPGITGWAQVNGRNALSWEEKFKLDVWYVDNWTIWLDLKILWLTLVKVLRREGISAYGHATMPEFKGGEKG